MRSRRPQASSTADARRQARCRQRASSTNSFRSLRSVCCPVSKRYGIGSGRSAFALGASIGSHQRRCMQFPRRRPHSISKRTMCRPTRLPYRGRLKWLGALSEDYAHPLHRGIGGSMYTRKAHAKRRASGLRAALYRHHLLGIEPVVDPAAFDFLHLLLREPLVGPLLEWPGCRLSVLVELLLGARVFTFLEQIFGLVALAPRVCERERAILAVAVRADGVGFLTAVEAVAHPPQLGGSVAGPALVRRDQEVETAAGHVGNLGGAPRAFVEFRSGGAAVDVFGLALAPSFLRAICSIPSFGIAKFAVNVCSSDTNKNTNKTDGCSDTPICCR